VAIVGVGVALAATLVVVAGTATDTSQGGNTRPTAIEVLLPEEGAVIRAQESVGVDLRDDLRGALIVDGNRIPEDQYTTNPGLGIYEFRPGPNQEFREFEPGTHEMQVEFWPVELTEEQAREQNKVGAFAWTFKVS